MNKLNWIWAHSKRNANLSSKAAAYLPPCVLSEMDILLEDNLLAASILLSTSIRTEGQESAGYFEGNDLVSGDNQWID
jgi:hypothetical protein